MDRSAAIMGDIELNVANFMPPPPPPPSSKTQKTKTGLSPTFKKNTLLVVVTVFFLLLSVSSVLIICIVAKGLAVRAESGCDAAFQALLSGLCSTLASTVSPEWRKLCSFSSLNV